MEHALDSYIEQLQLNEKWLRKHINLDSSKLETSRSFETSRECCNCYADTVHTIGILLCAKDQLEYEEDCEEDCSRKD